MSDDGASFASIACEPCRQKKCKCDRKLPLCSQCAAAPTKCQYPEQNRRGIPAGYLNSLEKRLAETEHALFFALAEIHFGTVQHEDYSGAAARAMRTSSQTKSDLMTNWAALSLEDRDRALSWFLEQRAASDIPTPQLVTRTSKGNHDSISIQGMAPSGTPSWISGDIVPVPATPTGYPPPGVPNFADFGQQNVLVNRPDTSPLKTVQFSYVTQLSPHSEHQQSQEIQGHTPSQVDQARREQNEGVASSSAQTRAGEVARGNKKTYF